MKLVNKNIEISMSANVSSRVYQRSKLILEELNKKLIKPYFPLEVRYMKRFHPDFGHKIVRCLPLDISLDLHPKSFRKAFEKQMINVTQGILPNDIVERISSSMELSPLRLVR